jgi:hypothetical protein
MLLLTCKKLHNRSRKGLDSGLRITSEFLLAFSDHQIHDCILIVSDRSRQSMQQRMLSISDHEELFFRSKLRDFTTCFASDSQFHRVPYHYRHIGDNDTETRSRAAALLRGRAFPASIKRGITLYGF